jgi:hypothetical protein
VYRFYKNNSVLKTIGKVFEKEAMIYGTTFEN